MTQGRAASTSIRSLGLFVPFYHFVNGPVDEPTWRCHQNPFIGALGIQEPVMPGEPLIEG
jgi:hypothetical protein